MTTTLLRLPAVMSKVGLKKAAIYAKASTGQFPKPVKMGGASGWRADEIDAWIAKISAARPASQPTTGQG